MLIFLRRALLLIIRLCRILVDWLQRLSARPHRPHGRGVIPDGIAMRSPNPIGCAARSSS
jgi:hypothetical protein